MYSRSRELYSANELSDFMRFYFARSQRIGWFSATALKNVEVRASSVEWKNTTTTMPTMPLVDSLSPRRRSGERVGSN